MPSEITSQIRRDHTRWECVNNPSANGTCGMVNDMDDNICEAPACRVQRSLGDYALNNSSQRIGELVSIDGAGTEYWMYYEKLVNGN